MAAVSVSERIKAARGQKKEHRDVPVVLDVDVREQVDALDDQINAAEAEIREAEEEQERIAPELRFSDPRPAQIAERIDAAQERVDALVAERDGVQRDTLVTLRFEKTDGEVWASLTVKHPPRAGSTIDRLSGYDYHAVAREAAPLCGYVLGDGDTREDLSEEDWAGLFQILSGREHEEIATSLWELNDFGPRRRIDDARKGSADGTGSRSS